jgi:hypothetical protein
MREEGTFTVGRGWGPAGTWRKKNDELYNAEVRRTWEKGCEWVGFVLGLIVIAKCQRFIT